MIETPEFLFAAPPKSGCRWMHGALIEIFGRSHVVHGSLHTIDGERRRASGKPLLSLVRDPAEWAKSYFQNINCPLGQDAVDAFLAVSRGEREPDTKGLRRFAGSYIAAGLSIGRMFAAYDPDAVWRIEDMPRALERFSGRTIRDRDRRATRNPLPLPADVRAMIYEHEREFCEQWGYPCRPST